MLASYYSPDNGFSKRICTFDHSELNNVVFVEGTQASLEIPRRNLCIWSQSRCHHLEGN